MHSSGVGVVEEGVVFIPLSGWRLFARLDHSDREYFELGSLMPNVCRLM